MLCSLHFICLYVVSIKNQRLDRAFLISSYSFIIVHRNCQLKHVLVTSLWEYQRYYVCIAQENFKDKLFPFLSYNPCTPHWLCLGAVTGFWSRSGIPILTHALTWGSGPSWESGVCVCKTWCFWNICTLFALKCEILRGRQTL